MNSTLKNCEIVNQPIGETDLNISVIMPTLGRPQLRRAIDSVHPYLGKYDELIVVGDGPRPEAKKICSEYQHIRYFEHYDKRSSFGNEQRNVAMHEAKGAVLAFLDDDDTYLPNAIASIRREAACLRPLIFRREYMNTFSWTEPRMIKGEVGTGMFVVPNILGKWIELTPELADEERGFADFNWINKILSDCWPINSVKFCTDIIYCCKGHGYGQTKSSG